MKAYVLESPGAGWTPTTLPDPEPGPGEVLVRVRAASLNYRDLMVATGRYPGRALKKDLIPLSDGAGEVESVGKGVTRLKKGDRVAASFHQDWLAGPLPPTLGAGALGGAVDGMLAERVCLKETGLVRVPGHLSFEEASTLPCAALTAWNALMECPAPLRPGASVLVQGTGGVSVFALQFAKLAGLTVVGTSKSDEKLERMRKLGLDHGVNYVKEPEWGKEAKRLTGGVDLVVEVGGATIQQSLQAVRTGGAVVMIGGLAGFEAQVPLSAIRGARARLQSVFVGSVAMFEDMGRAVAAARLKPVVDEVFPFERAKDALAKLESGAHFGKVVVRV
ncbi:MAG: NAD(P)-dependent alcohol dehydrogenase [Elusimicrobia bacterium]|nr:NAD(P)-dependent alcohol dehydrogenase [Elusimicrobiota bacterium]